MNRKILLLTIITVGTKYCHANSTGCLPPSGEDFCIKEGYDVRKLPTTSIPFIIELYLNIQVFLII